MSKYLLIVFSYLLSFNTMAQKDSVDAYLTYNWFQSVEGTFLPVLDNIEGRQMYFFLTKDQSGILEICNVEKYDVWIENQLVSARFKDGCQKLALDTLNNFYKSDTIFFRISSANLSTLTTTLLSTSGGESQEILQPRDKELWIDNFTMIFLLLILVLAAVYRHLFITKFKKSLRNPFNFKIRGVVAQDSYGKFAASDNLFALLFLSVFIAGLMLIVNSKLDLFGYQNNRLIGALGFWLVASLSFMMFCLTKYIFAQILAQIFNLQSIPNIQLQDFIHFMTFTCGVTFCLVFIDFSFLSLDTKLFLEAAKMLVIAAILFFQLWFYLKFVKYYSHRKLLIISYLCTTEFLPGFMAAYWLVN